ncbi:MAG: hypothetical protein QXG00_03955 [Candidatus Woesearchaeota archaeon]
MIPNTQLNKKKSIANNNKENNKENYIKKNKDSKPNKYFDNTKLIKRFFLLTILIVFLVIFSSLITIMIYDKLSVLAVREIRTFIIVNPDFRAGFNLDNETLHFGSINNGGEIKRWVHIHYTEDSIVNFKIYGNISNFIYVEENSFFLPKNQIKTIEFKAIIPINTKPGEYSGIIRIIFKKPSLINKLF